MTISGFAIAPFKIKPNAETIERVFTWTAPAIAIPGLRYTQDSHEQRKELFIRDASTYSIGALTFFLVRFSAQKFMDSIRLFSNLETRKLVAGLIGLSANLLYAGIGAVKFSKAFSNYQARKAQRQPAPHSGTPRMQPGPQQPIIIPAKPSMIPYRFPPLPQQPCLTSQSSLSPIPLPGIPCPPHGQTWGSPRFQRTRKVQYFA